MMLLPSILSLWLWRQVLFWPSALPREIDPLMVKYPDVAFGA
jgi:hypothetical protein